MAVAGLRHVGLKVLSIGLAALLWLLVSGEQLVERALRIPLELTNVPAQMEIVGEAPTVVDIRVRGSSGALGRIAAGELVAVLDLTEVRPGQRIFHLTASHVRVPFGVDVVQVMPSSVTMQFERSVSKIVPVVPAVEGEPAAGFVVAIVTSDPATVELVGADSVLRTITEAITEPVSMDGRAESFTDTVAIGSPDPMVRLRTPQMAGVTVHMTAAPVEWSVAGVPVQVRSATRRTHVSPGSVTVFVRGPVDAQGAAADIDASVDVAGLRAGQFDLAVRVVPPSKVGIVRVEPEHVRVTIR
jgi:hypothetical protein